MFSISRKEARAAELPTSARRSRAGSVSRRVPPNRKDAALEMGSDFNLSLLVRRATEERQGFFRHSPVLLRATGWVVEQCAMERIPSETPTSRSKLRNLRK